MLDLRGPAGRIHGAIARDLGVSILAGQLAPGALLAGEIERSDELKVSRGAYREAIRILAAKGLVHSRPKAGTRVSQRRDWNMLDPDVLAWQFEAGPSPEFLRDLFELRTVVEPAAAALAAERRDGRDLARMGHALEEMSRDDVTPQQWSVADTRFHDALLLASRNEMLVAMASSIAAALGWMAVYRIEHRHPLALLDEHRRVYDAIVAGDPVSARRVTCDLVAQVRRQIEISLGEAAETG